MRLLLLAAIQAYWRLVPARFRRTCLFRVSCSQHVYQAARVAGVRTALIALTDRWKLCRPGYTIVTREGRFQLVLCDGSVADESEIAPSLLRPFLDAAKHLRQDLEDNSALDQRISLPTHE